MKLIGSGFAGAMALGGYAAAYEPLVRLNTTRYSLTPPGWTPGLKLRVVALADIHACEPWMPASRVASICAAANRLEGDVIVLLGDYTSSMKWVTGPVPSRRWAEALSTLEAPLGVHAILGNHDWWEDVEVQQSGLGLPAINGVLRDAGLSVYGNEVARLEKDGHGFWIAGLEDQWALQPGRRWKRPAMIGRDDLPATLAQVTDDAPVILLAHEPDIFPDVPPRVSLTLSGHTHGGQVRLFGRSPVVPSKFGDRYAYGHVVEDDRNIIISGGLGCSIAPVRFGSPPEIVVIDLG